MLDFSDRTRTGISKLISRCGDLRTSGRKLQLPEIRTGGDGKNIARLIDDIDRLDINRRNMMDELQVLRDVTLFYNEAHPELRKAVQKPPAEDTRKPTDKGNTSPDRPATPDAQRKPARTPSPLPAATKEKSPGRTRKTEEEEPKL